MAWKERWGIAGPFDTASLLSAKGGGIEAAAQIEPASEMGVRGVKSAGSIHMRRLSMKLQRWGIKQPTPSAYTDFHAIRHG